MDTDILSLQRDVLVGLGMLMLDLMGSGAAASGLACTPGTGLTVSVAPGRLYQFENIDGTAYGSLPAITSSQIIKQGINLAATVLPCAAPVTAGYSINYLVEATYSDVDGVNVILPYYNVANPTQVYSGPNNSGNPQATVRQGQVVLTAKPGAAATTGTQTTPSVDSGYVGLYVVTVANGAGSITSGNIVTVATAPFLALTLAGGATTTTAPGAGGAGVLPATPKGYAPVMINGALQKIPYY